MIRTELSWLTRENSLGPVLLDGGTGSLLLERIGGDVPFSPLYNLSHPRMVVDLHKEFVAAGASVISTNSFCAASPYLAKRGMESCIVEINTRAVQLAIQAIKESGAPGVKVAGSVAPLPPELTEAEEKESFGEQMSTLINAGVDMLLCETFLDVRQGLRAVEVAHEASATKGVDLPVILSMVPPQNGTIPEDWETVAGAIADRRISLFGLNCGTGIELLARCLEQLDARDFGPYWVKPSTCLPEKRDAKSVYPTGPVEFANALAAIVKRFPVAAAGGCCGVGPEHVHYLRHEIDLRPNERACTNGSV